MILSGKQIQEELGKGLDITPFNPNQLNPNSYNLRLSNELLVYNTDPPFVSDGGLTWSKDGILDMAKENPHYVFSIPKDGYILRPGVLYLGRTIEHTVTRDFVPMLEGRSSIGRLGISIHATAGFGDVGFSGFWTLEISCVQPVRIYPGVEICQIYYHTIEKDRDILTYDGGKYQNNSGIQPSMLWKEFLK